MVESDIILDPLIRDNALIAIFLVFLFSNLIRQNLLVLTKDEPKVDMKVLKQNNVLGRCRLLKSGGGKFLTEDAFRNRRAFYTKKDTGLLVKAAPAKKDPLQAMEQQDPAQMVGMLKSQMIFLISQGAIGYWVNFLFTGFLVGKTPFPLTFRFKSMLQRGVDVENLEPGYISGLCWYFIIMMSIGGIQMFLMSLFEEEGKVQDSGGIDDPMQMMMGMPQQQMMNPMMGGPDTEKLYKQEKEALDIYYFETVLDGIETELWKKWKNRKL
ncbi:unnamed protein product [Amoebophrya sp. A120]|nr:unnamed protein product [Amoebophrya sp. A120]|eukprot:GSA120T00002362001.1